MPWGWLLFLFSGLSGAGWRRWSWKDTWGSPGVDPCWGWGCADCLVRFQSGAKRELYQLLPPAGVWLIPALALGTAFSGPLTSGIMVGLPVPSAKIFPALGVALNSSTVQPHVLGLVTIFLQQLVLGNWTSGLYPAQTASRLQGWVTRGGWQQQILWLGRPEWMWEVEGRHFQFSSGVWQSLPCQAEGLVCVLHEPPACPVAPQT